jgi:2-dehydro-3-deoxyphosphogalactonate aldolase
VRAWRSVLPEGVALFPVGGITPDRMGAYLEAGANGFGLGSALYRAGDAAPAVGERALRFVAAWQALHGRFVA